MKYADHDYFGWNNVEILHWENNKGKREFMEMLYIKKEGNCPMNLKRYLVRYNGCYDTMMNYISNTSFTKLFLEIYGFCKMV